MDSHQNEPFSKRLQRRIAASRFFTFSLLLHVVIVVMAGSVVLFHFTKPPDDFTAGSADGLVSQDAQVQPPAPQETPQDTVAPVTPTVSSPELAAITADTATPTTFQMPVAVPVARPSLSQNADMSKALAHAATGGPGNFPSAMRGRAGGTARAAAMKNGGGKEASERAVLMALNWLKAHQNEDGSWSEEYKPSMSGLALLCFLGHGETDTSVDYGVTVKKAVDWLIARGAEFQGRMSLTKDGFPGNEAAYQHAICAYAMGEYYSMTKDDRIKDVLTQSIKYITDGQNPDGGWAYSYVKGGISDTSVAGWQVQALKAAHLTGLQMPGVDEALDKSMLYFKDAQCDDGGFGYHTKNDERYALGGIGTLCVYFWKQDKDKLVHDGIKYIIEKTKKEYPVEYKGEKGDLYAWYYNTQACLMFGGEAWNRWNRWFQDEIITNQSKDGSYPPLEKSNSVTAALNKKTDGAGPFYRTTLCTLMLEVYYRYMPSNRS